MAHTCNLDLYNCNIAFEIPDLDGKSEDDVIRAVGFPKCVPVFARHQPDATDPHRSDSLPKYLVRPTDLVENVDQNDLRIKIIDLGEGSSQLS